MSKGYINVHDNNRKSKIKFAGHGRKNSGTSARMKSFEFKVYLFLLGPLARLGAEKDNSSAINLPNLMINSVKDVIDGTVRAEHDKRRCNRNNCIISCYMWTKLDKVKTSGLLNSTNPSV